MRPFATTIGLDEALAILEGAATPVTRVERVPLAEAAGRVLAADVVAAVDVPPFDRAAMDGYAVRAADTAGAAPDRPSELRVVGAAFAGEPATRAVGTGECVTIGTGAMVPEGADAVVMVEQTARGDGDIVHVLAPVAAGQHIGRRGSDIAAGSPAVAAGRVLTPARVGAVAAVGLASIEVYVRPRVALASTGNELVEPGLPLGPGAIHEINRYTLLPVVRAHGGEAFPMPTVADSLDEIRHCLDRASAAGADLVVLSGGSSVGDRDLLVDVVRERGEILFHGIAVRPGKPTMLARVEGRLLLGMPGNPTSCLSNAYVLLVPLLRRLARLPAWRPRTQVVPLARAVRNASGRHTFFTVRVERGEAIPVFKGSGDITSLADADGYIDIPADVAVLEAGANVRVTLY
jgi:molybdenum cofactor synthesis domain-containing protein